MTTVCAVLLGGVWGPDGFVTSGGMRSLTDTLSQLPNVSAQWFFWSNHQQAAAYLDNTADDDHRALIGFSGGGMAAIWVANAFVKTLDLLVLYDPSPPNQIQYLVSSHVRYALCYHNTNPRMWWPGIGQLGGGILRTSKAFTGQSRTIDINEWHLSVQNDRALHTRTIAAVTALGAGQDPLTAGDV